MTNNDRPKITRPKFHVGDALWRNIFRQDMSKKEPIIAILRRIPLFKDMRKSELHEFEKLIHVRRYQPDEEIFREGQPGVGMYIIQEGTVGIFKNTTEQSREELARLTLGEFFGELALLDEAPRSATAVALEQTKILGLFRPELLELIERKPRTGSTFLLHLATLIGERLKHTNAELRELWLKFDDSKLIT